MKFECEKTLLASAIDGVSRAITNRAAIPVLEGIYMKAEGFNLTLTGDDMEMGITTTIECNVLVPGETVLDAKLLSAMVNRMPAGDVCIELNDEGQAKNQRRVSRTTTTTTTYGRVTTYRPSVRPVPGRTRTNVT